jgi:signal transduction histidine kinase
MHRRSGCGPFAFAEVSMTHRRHEEERRERKRKRKVERAERERVRREAQALEDSLLSPEERVLRQAERTAEEKAELTEELIKFGVITVLLLIFLPPVGIVMLFWGGARHFRSFNRLVTGPRLREKYLRREVDKRVHAHLSGERQELESVHAHSMQELSARVAHEIRNPITAAKSLVQQMEEEPGAPENVEYARVALEELSRVERSVSHLLRFARDEELRMGAVSLADIVDSALETFRERAARSGVRIERSIDGAGEIRGDAEKLRRVVINLVTNALDAIDGTRRGSGRVAIGVGENLAGTEVWLRVADDGPGLDAEAMSRIWSPFYTSKANGTGLGLPICKKLVEAHGGMIEVTSAPEGGADFVAVFPKRRAEGGLA